MVVHGPQPFMPEAGSNDGGDQAGFIAADQAFAEDLDQGRRQPIAGFALGRRQAQPLHLRRAAFARCQEQCCEPTTLGGRRLVRPGRKQALGLGVRCGHVQARGSLRSGGVEAVGGHALRIAFRVATHGIALEAGQVFGGDQFGLPGDQSLQQRFKQGGLERLGQAGQVGGAQYQHLVRSPDRRPLQLVRMEGGPIGGIGSEGAGTAQAQDQEAGQAWEHAISVSVRVLQFAACWPFSPATESPVGHANLLGLNCIVPGKALPSDDGNARHVP